jgi:ABC-type branched-subunit amino acid transport system ATPase component
LDALATVGLADHAERSAGTLTYGQQRLLELARALAGEPRVLLLDEPSAGLNDDETRSLTSLLRIVQERGISMLLVDHKVDFIDELCDRVLVLELGRRVSEGSPAEIWADTRVRDAYLGGSAGA